MRLIWLGVMGLALAVTGTSSEACSFAGRPNTRETRQAVDTAVQQGAAILDAVVERPNGRYGTPEEWAVLRTVRIWKGPVIFFQVDYTHELQ